MTGLKMPKLPLAYNWSYGAEHELADWDSRKGLPKGYARAPDYTIVNSNGIAAQPDAKLYPYGGEVNTPPTLRIIEQVECINIIRDMHPDATINYRSNLHVHIRVPGLKDSLDLLKKIQRAIHIELPLCIDLIEPISKGTTPAERKREKRCYVSHHTFLSNERVAKQVCDTETVKEFFEAEVPKDKSGRVLWHLQPRVCVNLRQLLQTDTVEFRHFPGTLDENELLTAILWCRDFLIYAIEGKSIKKLAEAYTRTDALLLPRFSLFQEALEIGYQATCTHGEFTKQEIRENIKAIEGGTFDDTEAHRKATSIARGLSWKHLPKPIGSGSA